MLPNNLDLILVSIGVSDGSLLYLNHLCDVKLVTSLIGVAPKKILSHLCDVEFGLSNIWTGGIFLSHLCDVEW